MTPKLRELLPAIFASIQAVVTFRLPSFSYTRMRSSPDVVYGTSDHPSLHTARHEQLEYLNGLRGLASLVVYIWHFSWPFQPQVFFAYGLDSENKNIMQLPFLRLLYAGDAMVRVFFVLSGFVLALGPLTAIGDGNKAALANKISSMGIRRGFRLFIPPLFISVLTLMTTSLGWLDDMLPSVDPPSRSQQHSFIPVHHPTFWLQVLDWLRWVIHSLINPWPPVPNTAASQYGPQFWTIPHEFRCSMTIFLLLIVLAPIQRRLRILIAFGLSAYCMMLEREQEELSLFVVGMGLADLERRHLDLETLTSPRKRRRWLAITELGLCWLLMIFSLYLLSWPPNKGYLTPCFRWMGMLDRRHNHWHNIGAIILLYTVLRIQPVQRALGSSLAKYLGRISYALYCTHYLLVLVVGRRFLGLCWHWTGRSSWLAEQGGFLLGFIGTTLVVIMASEGFQRVIDLGAIRIAAAAEKWLTA